MALITPWLALHFAPAAVLALVSGATMLPLPASAAAVVRTAEVRAELIAYAPSGVLPGRPIWLGLQLEHAPQWHTYWKNPGDSGVATTLEWALPKGVSAGEVDWPAPLRLPIGPLVNYGYEGRVLLPVPLSLPAGYSARTVDLKLHADWLVCKVECIPQSGEFEISLPAGAAPLSEHRSAFEAAFEARPASVAAAETQARIETGALVVTARGLPAGLRGLQAQVFPEVPGVIEPAAAVRQEWSGATWTARLPLAMQRSASPGQLPMVLRFGDTAPVRLDAPVAGRWPGGAAGPREVPQGHMTDAGAGARLGLALLAALAGGLLLNLMPCVFPVLSLKVLGFAQQAGHRRRLLAGALAYAAGVLLSFLSLGAVLLALRTAGEQLGWGFQLQSSAVVAALALLFTVIGLNLAGVFETRSVLPAGWLALRVRHPAADAFLSGVLAVVVASPCTAPFMGASLGLALTLPAGQALAVFAALGLGLALPYVVMSAVPALARSLPKPGPWLARFKTAMAFPMFATVVWLLWVLGQQVGVGGAAAWLGVLVAASFALWAWGASTGSRMRLLGGAAVGLLAATLWWAWPMVAPLPPSAGVQAAGERWLPWTPGRVQALVAQGQPVFVDFTAAWCVTCQINKRTTLADDEVLADFDRRRVTLLRADWTRRDPAITSALASLGRSGVPVYVLYRAGRPPVVLSEILTVREVRSALASL